ncbi:hypothetical protein CsSME_00053829 [Camellia sinensis var. sinensis]
MEDSSGSVSQSIPSNLALLISNLSSFVTVKLDSTNYIVWKKLVAEYITSNKIDQIY